MLRRFLCAGVLAGLLYATISASYAAPENVLVSRGRTEPSIAIDPHRPSIIVVSANTDYDAPIGDTYPTGYFWSWNGGRTFSAGAAPVVRPYTSEADTSVEIDRKGTVFYSYLAETPGYCSGGQAAILVTHSTDHGVSFHRPVVVDANAADDKPFMAVENTTGRFSRVFITWTRWHDHGSEIWYAESDDGGASFSRPRSLFTSRLNNFGSVPVAGPDHHVYVFWSGFPDWGLSRAAPMSIMMRRSLDDGKTFEPARRITRTFWSIPRMAPPQMLRNVTGPSAGVGRHGELYLAWAQATRTYRDGHVDANIMVMRSVNGGMAWSSPHRVNDVTRNDRFMPALSVFADGSVGLAFYDRRDGSAQVGVYAVRASFSGGFWISRNVRVNARSSPTADMTYIAPGSTCFSPGRFFGDYIGAAHCARLTLCVVWADTQLRIPDETDIWFSRPSLPSRVH